MLFKTITLNDLSQVKSIVEKTTFRSCQLSAGGLYSLSEKYGTEVCFADGFLFVKQRRKGFGVCYFMPVGVGSLSAAFERLRRYHAEAHGGDFVLWGIADDMVDDFRSVSGDFADAELVPDRDWAEYIHEAKNLLTLSGKRLQPKRNAANQFRRSYDGYEYEPISTSNLEEVWNFQQQQLEAERVAEKNATLLTLLEEENRSIQLAIAAWKEIGLTGGVIRIDKKIKAFTFGCPINADTFDVMFESAEHSYNGIFQVLEQELIGRLSGFTYINREEDLGIPGLRFAKQNLRPDILLMKYSARICTPQR
ncbi:MAG: phosphatidylglycerol lysyltransferase domain-containing protein [Prevotellaceae bacterium]|nr:phosphatidylglycerol lysyltransferase domain-containing protein [Prevotellaceae bacterium]